MGEAQPWWNQQTKHVEGEVWGLRCVIMLVGRLTAHSPHWCGGIMLLVPKMTKHMLGFTSSEGKRLFTSIFTMVTRSYKV